jgi:hypothetical protein
MVDMKLLLFMEKPVAKFVRGRELLSDRRVMRVYANNGLVCITIKKARYIVV